MFWNGTLLCINIATAQQNLQLRNTEKGFAVITYKCTKLKHFKQGILFCGPLLCVPAIQFLFFYLSCFFLNYSSFRCPGSWLCFDRWELYGSLQTPAMIELKINIEFPPRFAQRVVGQMEGATRGSCRDGGGGQLHRLKNIQIIV